jgi:hypothetical protein
MTARRVLSENRGSANYPCRGAPLAKEFYAWPKFRLDAKAVDAGRMTVKVVKSKNGFSSTEINARVWRALRCLERRFPQARRELWRMRVHRASGPRHIVAGLQ